jgi:hypothetical protein
MIYGAISVYTVTTPEHLLMIVILKKLIFFPLFFSLFTVNKKGLKIIIKKGKPKKINFIDNQVHNFMF